MAGWAWLACLSWCLALAVPTLVLSASLGSAMGVGMGEGMGHVPLDLPVSTWPPLAQALVLRPDTGLAQPPWVWWTTAWLHGSTPHLVRNVVSLALLAAWAAATQPSRATSLALWLAWPLTQLGMLTGPSLGAYVGLSGVLHAGLVVLALGALAPSMSLSMSASATRPIQAVALALLLGLTAKVIMENPWGEALVASTASAIRVAPWAHLSGCAAGVVASAMAAGLGRWPRRCH